jgi:hypothetical protein
MVIVEIWVDDVIMPIIEPISFQTNGFTKGIIGIKQFKG